MALAIARGGSRAPWASRATAYAFELRATLGVAGAYGPYDVRRLRLAGADDRRGPRPSGVAASWRSRYPEGLICGLLPERHHADKPDMGKTPVLVVDDEDNIRRFLRRFLERWDYDVIEADNAVAALDQLAETPVDIVFCDIRMPGHDGLWLVERVRQRWPRTAIIIASGVDDFQTVLKAKKDGAIDYVMKPFGRELLLQALERAKESVARMAAAPAGAAN